MIEENIKNLIINEITQLGYTYLDVTYKKENGVNILRITVDKDEPISLDDIVHINEVVSPIIDEADLINEKYMLDITSLGIEKPIAVDKLQNYVTKYVNIHLISPIKGENYLEGTLLSVDDKEVIVEVTNKTRKIKVSINREIIDKARLAIKF